MPLPAVRVTVGDAQITFSDEAEVVVGCGPGAGVAVHDDRVLPEHSVLQRHPGAWVLVDRSGGLLFLDGFPIPMLPIAEPVEVRLADAEDGPRLALEPATLDGAVGTRIPAEATRIGVARGTLLPPPGRPRARSHLGDDLDRARRRQRRRRRRPPRLAPPRRAAPAGRRRPRARRPRLIIAQTGFTAVAVDGLAFPRSYVLVVPAYGEVGPEVRELVERLRDHIRIWLR
jgi:hypothetical protein